MVTIIGISGASCSGKTTLSSQIVTALDDPNDPSRIVLLSQDRYYKGGDEDTNYDVPDAIDWTRLVNDVVLLKSGNEVDVPIYDFSTHSRSTETDHLVPSRIIIIEGILIFCCAELLDLIDVKVFVEADDDILLHRRIQRDVRERGRTEQEVKKRYKEHVKPSNLGYVNPSSKHAQIILRNNEENHFIGTEVMLFYIQQKYLS